MSYAINARYCAVSLVTLVLLVRSAALPQEGDAGAVRRLMDSVSISRLASHVALLQYAGGHRSRVTFTPGNDSAAVYIRHAFDGMQHLTTVQNDLFFIPSATPPFNSKVLMNIVGTLRGHVDASKVIVVGAHFDCSASRMTPDWSAHWDTVRAPGADDNATGVAALLEVARILSDTSTGFSNDHTIRFIAFGAEESGPAYAGAASHSGSVHWAQAAKSRGEDVVGMISVDMIGYNAQHLFQSVVTNAASTSLANTFNTVNDSNHVGLTLNLTSRPNDAYSDHFSFWLAGYPAICLIEYAWPWNPYVLYQPNPVYHTSFDTIGTVNMELVRRVTQLIVGAVASMTGKVTGIGREAEGPPLPSACTLFQNYPNPFNPTTVVSYLLPVAGRVELVVYDLLGREVLIPVNEREPAGDHSVMIDGRGLASGVYLYRLVAVPDGGQAIGLTRRMVLVK